MKKNSKNKLDKDSVIPPINIGELFLNKRTQIGVSIQDAAEAVKLSASVVEKLENVLFDEIGGHVYVRGYLSQYAKFLGLDTVYILSLYHEQYPPENVPIRPSLGSPGGRKKSKRHSKTVSFLIAFITFVSLIVAYSKFEPQFFPAEDIAVNNVDGKKDNSTNDEVVSEVSSAIRAADSAQILADDVLNDMTLPSSKITSLDGAFVDENTLNADFEEVDPAKIVLSSAGDDSLKKVKGQSEEQVKVEGTKSDEDSKKSPSDEIQLVISFNKDCWIKISDFEKKILATNIYTPKKKIDVRGKPPFTIIIARKLSVETVILNGKKVNLKDYQVGNVKYIIK